LDGVALPFPLVSTLSDARISLLPLGLAAAFCFSNLFFSSFLQSAFFFLLPRFSRQESRSDRSVLEMESWPSSFAVPPIQSLYDEDGTQSQQLASKQLSSKINAENHSSGRRRHITTR
jgi:hypothetical protein